MDIKLLSSEYKVRRLNEKDIPEIFALCESNPIYYQYCPPAPTVESIQSDMTILPSGKKADEKYYIGFFKQRELVAVMDLIDGYPEPQTAFIGFFMINHIFQRKGIGTKIISDTCHYLKNSGYLKVKLGYAKGNIQSERFWANNQFAKTKKETQADGYIIVNMERCLLSLL